MATDSKYDALVAQKRAELRGEIFKFKPVNILAPGATISGTSLLPDGTKITIGPQIIQPKRRPGRPKGSKNKPKA